MVKIIKVNKRNKIMKILEEKSNITEKWARGYAVWNWVWTTIQAYGPRAKRSIELVLSRVCECNRGWWLVNWGWAHAHEAQQKQSQCKISACESQVNNGPRGEKIKLNSNVKNKRTPTKWIQLITQSRGHRTGNRLRRRRPSKT